MWISEDDSTEFLGVLRPWYKKVRRQHEDLLKQVIAVEVTLCSDCSGLVYRAWGITFFRGCCSEPSSPSRLRYHKLACKVAAARKQFLSVSCLGPFRIVFEVPARSSCATTPHPVEQCSECNDRKITLQPARLESKKEHRSAVAQERHMMKMLTSFVGAA